MALALTHFAFGAGVMVLVSHWWFREHSYRWTAVAGSGVWALVPDLHYLTAPYGTDLSWLNSSVLGNLFWFHRVLDMGHRGRGTREMAALSLFFLCSMVLLSELLDAGERQ